MELIVCSGLKIRGLLENSEVDTKVYVNWLWKVDCGEFVYWLKFVMIKLK